MTQDFGIGIRVGRATRDIFAFWVDQFLPRYPFYPQNCWIWMKFGTHIVEVID